MFGIGLERRIARIEKVQAELVQGVTDLAKNVTTIGNAGASLGETIGQLIQQLKETTT